MRGAIPLKLWQVAGVGFLAGVMLHACVFLAVLGEEGNGSGGNSGSPSQPANPTARPLPTATRIADRMNCDAIRGTDYRSESERLWFFANCI